MNKADGLDKSAYKVWDRVKVSKGLFDRLITHPAFEQEPKAINTAQYWLSEIDAAIERNDGNGVTWDHKDIQDRFRQFAQSHTVFRDALRELGLITFSTYRPPPNPFVQGTCRVFTITRLGHQLVSDGNQQWLYNLLKDPLTRRRNQIAISKRKRTRVVYTEPIKRIIDEFRHKVEFEEDPLLRQLRDDGVRNLKRCRSAYHHLVALVSRKFRRLELKEGRIYYEFVALPSEYRRFALLDDKSYVATVDIRACHPSFLGEMLRDFHHEESGAIAAKLGQPVDAQALDTECKRWTFIFTGPTDPRDWIAKKAAMRIHRNDMKQCLNRWLNGGKEYQRGADGKRVRKDHGRLEAWFKERFPEMARVWTAMEERRITGRLITEEYEGPLLLDPELYEYAESLGLTLAYEYDGVGVFAKRDDPELPAKLEKVAAFIQRKSVERFTVPVVVKTERLAQ